MKGNGMGIRIKNVCSKIYEIQERIRRTVKEAEVETYASGTAFFLFLSIIPVIMMASRLFPSNAITPENMVNISQAVMPERVYGFLADIAGSYHGNQVTLLSVSAAVALWSASKGVLALICGLNHIYEVEESRHYILLRLRAAFYTIFLMIAIILSIGILVFGNTIAKWLIADKGGMSEIWQAAGWLRHIVVAAMISVVFCTMYSILPNKRFKWKEHYPGAVFTSVFWTLYSFGFSVYIDCFDGFSMYGSLTTIIIVMIWLYFCMYIFFCGALVNKWIAEGGADGYLQ